MQINPVAKIITDLPAKFGLPRQSGLIEELEGTIVFEPEYRVFEALRGIERYSHLWLIWGFSENEGAAWTPTVRPPKLGGNKRVGVFATRSPFRPNMIGLSCVKLLGVEKTEKYGHVIRVSGVDLMNETPIYDIKPYLPISDCRPDAFGGITDTDIPLLEVSIPQDLLEKLPSDKHITLKKILEQDPRPAYQDDPDRIYGFGYAGFEIKFKVDGNKLIVTNIVQEY